MLFFAVFIYLLNYHVFLSEDSIILEYLYIKFEILIAKTEFI